MVTAASSSSPGGKLPKKNTMTDKCMSLSILIKLTVFSPRAGPHGGASASRLLDIQTNRLVALQ